MTLMKGLYLFMINIELSKIKKIIIPTVTLFLLSVIYCFYIKYYYGSITINNFISHTVGSLNIFGSYIYYLIDKIFSTENLLQTIIISGVVVYILINMDIANFTKRISNISIGDFTISATEAMSEKQKDDEDIESLEKQENKDADKLEYLKIKSEFIQLLIDNHNLIGLIETVISGNRNIKIPLHLIPRDYSLKEISKIFEYKVFSNTVRVICIKKDIEPILIDAYNDLKQKGIIYETVK